MARMRANQLSSEYYRSSDSIDSYFFRTTAFATSTAAEKKKNYERIKMCGKSIYLFIFFILFIRYSQYQLSTRVSSPMQYELE